MARLQNIIPILTYLCILAGHFNLNFGHTIVPFIEDNEDFNSSGDNEFINEPKQDRRHSVGNSHRLVHRDGDKNRKDERYRMSRINTVHLTMSEAGNRIQEGRRNYGYRQQQTDDKRYTRKEESNQKRTRHGKDNYSSRPIPNKHHHRHHRKNQGMPSTTRKPVLLESEFFDLHSILADADGSNTDETHRKIIVYDFIPDLLRKEVQDRDEKNSSRSPEWNYYDRLARIAAKNGSHCAIVFDADEPEGTSWSTKKPHKGRQMGKRFDSDQETGKSENIPDDPRSKSPGWPSFQSLLTRVKEGLIHDEIKTPTYDGGHVEPLDEDYQSDSYHHWIPEIDGKSYIKIYYVFNYIFYF